MNNLEKDQNLSPEEKTLLVPAREKTFKKDQNLKTKQISSFRDALSRFMKNKASVVAATIIGILLIFTIIGPFLKNYDLNKTDYQNAVHFEALPPKIPGLEHLGIFDGSRELVRSKSFVEQLPEGIVLAVLDENIADGSAVRVRVDYYRYTNFVKSYMNENGELQTRNMDQVAFDEALRRNAIIDVQNIIETSINGETYRLYVVRVDLFKLALNQSPEDTYFWFGTSQFGDDLFIQLWEGARVSLALAVTISVINIIIGVILGSLAGYYGGTFDLLFDRLVDILAALPLIAIITILLLRYGSQMWVIILAFIMTGWIGNYARTRMQFYRFKNREYVLAARSLGANDRRIMFKHILPNAIGTLVTSFSLAIPAFVASEAVYSFLGIIDYGDVVGVGQLLARGQEAMFFAPHLLYVPAVYMGILMLSFNLFGNGLRDAFNTSLRGAD